QARVRKFYDKVSKTWNVTFDTTTLPARYANGEVLAAQHVLVTAQLAPGAPDVDSAMKKAQAIRAQAVANPSQAAFATPANKNNGPEAAGPGGDLGVFPRGQMVKEFETALLALKPGEISPVVRSQFGYHVIRRLTYDEAKSKGPQMQQMLMGRQTSVAEST